MAGRADFGLGLDRIVGEGGVPGHDQGTEKCRAPKPREEGESVMEAAFRYEKDGALLPRPYNVSYQTARVNDQSTVKAMMLLPRLKSIWVLPPAPTTMYCLPSTE